MRLGLDRTITSPQHAEAIAVSQTYAATAITGITAGRAEFGVSGMVVVVAPYVTTPDEGSLLAFESMLNMNLSTQAIPAVASLLVTWMLNAPEIGDKMRENLASHLSPKPSITNRALRWLGGLRG